MKYIPGEHDFKYLASDLTNPNNFGPHHKRAIVFRFRGGGGEVLYRYSIDHRMSMYIANAPIENTCGRNGVGFVINFRIPC